MKNYQSCDVTGVWPLLPTQLNAKCLTTLSNVVKIHKPNRMKAIKRYYDRQEIFQVESENRKKGD